MQTLEQSGEVRLPERMTESGPRQWIKAARALPAERSALFLKLVRQLPAAKADAVLSEILRARVAPLSFVVLAGRERGWKPDALKDAVDRALGMVSSVLDEPQFKARTLFRLLAALPPDAREFVLSRLVLSAGERLPGILGDLLGQDETVDFELIETIARLSNQTAAEAIQVAADNDPRKAVRKKARALLYGLGIKGVAVETKPRPVFSPVLPVEPPEEIARLSAVDQEFDRLLILAESAPRSRFEVVQAVFSYGAGMRSFVEGLEERNEFKKRLTRFAQESEDLHLTDISPAFALFLIAAACHAFPATVTPECRDWLNRKGVGTGEPPAHPIHELSSPESPPPGFSPLRALDRSPIRNLRVPPQAIPAALARWKELADSPIILPEYQKKARANEILLEAAREYFTEERKRSFRRFLEDEAYLKRESAPIEARELLDAAAALDPGSADTTAPPELLEFLRRQLDRLAGKPQGGRAGRKGEGTGAGRILLPGTRGPRV
jgi:hypothetical protein